MTIFKSIAQAAFVALGLVMFASGCVGVVEPREGYWDRDHHRWYHEHAWHDCVENDEHCR
jgi:hypothetical protein